MELTDRLASKLAELPLGNLRREYPNVLAHVLNGPDDIKSPRELHPSFYGCFDWHSSVHSHWMLVKLLKEFDLDQEDAVREALNETLTAPNLLKEAAYFNEPNRVSFERMYGWTWLLKLADELSDWEDDDGEAWSAALKPLEDVIVDRYMQFLPKQTYPIRLGTHTNTAFGLTFALDYAAVLENEDLHDLIMQRALEYFGEDEDAPIQFEPSGADFLSPALIEADLMRRVLPGKKFVEWFDAFIPSMAQATNLLRPVTVSDRTDPQIAHLDGLNLSRAWCMSGIASALPSTHRAVRILKASGEAHAREGLANVASGHYAGEHWLASFAVYLLMD
jgi:hypothetical protein